MERDIALSRKQFLGAAAGTAAAAGLAGAWATRALASDGPPAGKDALITISTLSVQQFSIRDATGRLGFTNNPSPAMGFLGGPDFPEDPTDLGPLVPLPGGFAEVFEYLASIGYFGIEFFSLNQNIGTLGRQPTVEEIRSYLDAAGLRSHGTHQGSIGAMFDPATDGLSTGGMTQVANARILGHDIIGTAGDPSGRTTLENNPANPNQIGWQEAARRANIIGAALREEGLRGYYFHPEQNTFRFFDPVANPELAETHLISWFSDNTDPNKVFFELDILHSLSGRKRFPLPSGPDFDPYGWVTSDPKRFLAYHLKDGNVNPTWAGPPAAGPYVQTFLRTPTFTDAVGVGEGDIGKGYPSDNDPASVGFPAFIAAKGNGNRYHIVESDSGPGPATGANADPGRSLRHAKISAQYLLDT
jgi:sugar phosphate isomerase/epimerase